MEEPELSKDDVHKLKLLQELITYGHSCFSELKVDWTKVKLRKKTLLKMAAAIQGHTESGYILLEKGQTHSAEVLVRPILETLIDAEYIICGRNNETLNRFMTMGNTTLITKMNTMLKFKNDNPDIEVKMTDDDLLEAIKSRQDENKQFSKNFRYKVQTADIGVADRVIRVDAEYKRLGKKSPFSKYWRYLTEYTLLSDNVHLGARGLKEFMIESPTRVDLVFGGRLNNVPHVIDAYYVHYIEMLRIMHGQFKLADIKEIRKFEKAYKLG